MGGDANIGGDVFRVIAQCIDRIQAAGGELRDVAIDNDSVFSEEKIKVHLKLALPELSAVAALGIIPEGENVTLTEDDTCLLEVTIDVPLDQLPSLEEIDGVSPEGQPAGTDAETPEQKSYEKPAASNGDLQPDEAGGETATVDSTNGEDTSAASAATEPADGSEASTATGEKAYRDPERLRAVYEEYETFPEMRDALDADVTAQTVRRHMIKHGIHEVSSNTALEALQNTDVDQVSRVLGTDSTEDPGRSRSVRGGVDRPEGTDVSEQQLEEFDNRTR